MTTRFARPHRGYQYLFWIFTMLLLAACDLFDKAADDAPPGAAFELSSPSKNQHFTVTVSTETESRPPVGKFHNWLVTITDAQSRPVYPVIVAVGGGMPAHGHGLPTQPQVTEYLGGGVYRLEGVKFNMGGAWVIKFRIVTQQMEDSVEFDFNVQI